MNANGWKHNKTIKTFFVVLLSVMSDGEIICQSKTDVEVIEPCSSFSGLPPKEKERVKHDIITKGGRDSYRELRIRGNQDEYLYYSILMAQKYKLPSAFFDVYDAITKMYDKHHISMDLQTWNYVYSYLEMGTQFNCWECSAALEHLYLTGNEFVSIDSTKALYYKEKRHSISNGIKKKSSLEK